MRMSANKSRLIVPIVMLMAMCAALTSCDPDEDYYYDNDPALYGNWEQMYVSGFDASSFSFFRDGSGNYSSYDRYGVPYTWSITWNTWGDQLQIYVISTGETWNYQYSYSRGILTLYDLDYGGYLYYQAY